MLSKLNNKPYILKTTLKPNQIYSCFGIKIKVKEQVDTFSNKGNFSIHINNINLKALKSQSHNTITKDTPLFCYVQESNQTHIVKLQDSTTNINIQLNKNLPKDSNGNLIPIIPKLIFLSFIPFRDSKEANNSPSQKIALTADDIDKNYINVDFKIPLKYLGEWQNIKTHKLQQAQSNKSKEILSIRFNGKTLQILEKGKTTQEFTFKAQSGDNVNKETMIEEGNYYIKANEVIEANIINNVNIDINQFNLGNKYIKLHKNITHKNTTHKETSNNNTANKNTSNNKTSNKKTLKDDSFTSKIFNLVKIQSTAYTIHGGKSYGDNKGIDLATQDLAFFKALQKLTNKYKVELENANNEIRVEVGYGFALAHSPLADLIGQAESQNKYTMCNHKQTNSKGKEYYGAKDLKELTMLPLSTIMQKQQIKEIFAAGRFQIVKNTLLEAKNALNLNGNDLFNEDMQDRIFEEYLINKKRPAVMAYLKENGDIDKAAYALAKEFASIGVKNGWKLHDYPKGNKRVSNGKQSFYENIGGNKMIITYESVIKALKDTKKQIGGY